MVHEKSFMWLNATRYDGGKDQPKVAAQRLEPPKRNDIALLCLNHDAQNLREDSSLGKIKRHEARWKEYLHESCRTSSEEKACIENRTPLDYIRRHSSARAKSLRCEAKEVRADARPQARKNALA
jgi:hypothetical protein